MNLQKTIMSLLFFIMTSVTVFAQNDIDNQVNDLIKLDNIRLTEHDESLKLSEEQETKAKEIYRALVLIEKEVPRSKKKNKDEFNKIMMSKRGEAIDAVKSLLTPKQLAAYRTNGVH